MPLDLDAIRARLTKATPGPWYRNTVPDGDPIDGPDNTVIETDDVCARGELIARVVWGTNHDAILVSNAPTDIAALLSEVDRLTAENEGLHADNEALRAELADTMTVLEDAKNDCDKMLRRLGVDNTDD